jgi:hypothetical protein
MALEDEERVAEEQTAFDESQASEQATRETRQEPRTTPDFNLDDRLAELYSKFPVPQCFQHKEVVPQSEEEMRTLETWRSQALSIIDQRIAQYTTPQELCAQHRCVTTTSPEHTISLAPGSSSRALGIGEIVECVLQFADPGVHFAAWSVNHLWRKAAVWVMGEHGFAEEFCKPQSAQPVERAELIRESDDYPNIRVTAEELEKLDKCTEELYSGVLQRCIDSPNDLDPPDTINLPARLTQAINLPTRLSQRINVLLHEQSEPVFRLGHLQVLVDTYSNHVHLPQWLDFSQFEMNPYMNGLFPHRFAVIDGTGEVSCRPSCSERCHVIDRHTVSKRILALISNQFITRPPIVNLNLGIWIPSVHPEEKREWISIGGCTDTNGIRIGAFIDELERAAPKLVSYWKYWAQQLRRAVANGHWTQDVWFVSGVPKFAFTLDNGRPWEDLDRELDKFDEARENSLMSRSTRESEWVSPNLRPNL